MDKRIHLSELNNEVKKILEDFELYPELFEIALSLDAEEFEILADKQLV